MRDAYDKLFTKYPKDDFFRDALEEIIFIQAEKLQSNWESLKYKLLNNEELYIRGHGRDAGGTELFLTLYKHLFNHDKIKKDPTNNLKPTQVITTLTGLDKTIHKDTAKRERIQNYQVSHLFGRTKNPLLFTAAWNIAYIPKYLDPFTGHETQGKYRREFQTLFNDKIFNLFQAYVNDYNDFVDAHVSNNIEMALLATQEDFSDKSIPFEKFKLSAVVELSRIATVEVTI
jgi:hypothetical protein